MSLANYPKLKSLMDTAEAADETLEYICDMAGSDMVLNELVDYMSIDDLVCFLQDFIVLQDVDTSDLDDDCIELLNEHYRLHC